MGQQTNIKNKKQPKRNERKEELVQDLTENNKKELLFNFDYS
jgi:hypothetical protein